MLHEFSNWTDLLISYLNNDDMKITKIVGPTTNNPAIVVDLDTKADIGRMVCWSDGAFDAEILNIETGFTRYRIDDTLKVGDCFPSIFSKFFSKFGLDAKLLPAGVWSGTDESDEVAF